MNHITEREENWHEIRLANGSIVHLIGTAHVSQASADLVERAIEEVRPAAVCVELCSGRYQSLQNPDRWRNTDIAAVIRDGKAYVLMAQLILAGFQKKIAKQFGIKPGAEMIAALECARKSGAEIRPVDREIKATLKRAWSRAGFWSLAKIVASTIDSMRGGQQVTEAEIENLKRGDALAAVMNEFSEHLPGVKDALIDERDSYMAAKIGDVGNEFRTVLAVVGAGHVPGILLKIGTTIDVAELEKLPVKSKLMAVMNWLIPGLIIAVLVAGFFTTDMATSFSLIGWWILITGSCAALGAVIALAHPLTVLSAFVAAPITTLHPALAAGWVAGLVEAIVRKPRVADLESLVDDFGSIPGLWKNRVSKIFLVMVFCNLGAALGAAIGIGSVVSRLS